MFQDFRVSMAFQVILVRAAPGVCQAWTAAMGRWETPGLGREMGSQDHQASQVPLVQKVRKESLSLGEEALV